MKKSLLMILGAAALLAGCAKDLSPEIEKLEDRVAQLEQQVEANKKAIEELQKANFITGVEQTESGWSITLDDGKVLALYNGKDGENGQPGEPGKDGDAFFKSVEISGSVVIFTLTDGTSFELPFQEDFKIVLSKRDVVVEPDTEVKIPFSIVGKTEDTEVYVIAGGAYEAEIKGDAVVVKIPSTITKDAVLLAADNGHGKTSIKSLNFEEHSFAVGDCSQVAYFWGSKVSFKVTSNVKYSVTTSASWLTVVSTKAVTENTVTIKVSASPCSYTRTGEVYVMDAYNKVIQTVKISQGGTAPVMVFNTSYKSIAAAVAAAVAGTDEGVKTNGYVDIAISEAQAPIEEIVAIPESDMRWVVRVRSLGGGKAENCVIRGIDVRNTELEVKDITIEPVSSNAGNRPLAQDGDTYGKSYFGYAYGLCVETGETKSVTVKNVIFKVNDDLVTYANATLLYVCPSTGLVTLDGCQIDGRGSRIAQIYGGNVTFNGCNIANGYSSYAVRMGDANNTLVFTNNLFDTKNIVNVYKTTKSSALTFGADGLDNNRYSKNLATKYTNNAEAGGITITEGQGVAEGTVDLNGMYTFATVQEAVNAAAEGDVITIGEQEYPENVKISKNVTIQGKSRENSIIAGNVEIASGATFRNLTVKEKAGVTNSILTLTNSYNWGHKYLFRVELGADGVLLENANVIADDADATEDFKSSVSTIWISEARDVTIKNCKIVTTADGAYCANQTYDAKNVVFDGNEFEGGGKKDWSIRACAATDITIRNNTFHSKYAVDVYDTFKGTLIIGDGEIDNNTYGSEVAVALNGNKSALLEAGALFLPEDVIFNSSETVVVEPAWEKVWHANADALAINDSRGYTYWNGEVLCGVAAGDKNTALSPAPYLNTYPMVTVADGAVSKTLATPTVGGGFTGWVTGVTTVENNGQRDLLACGVVATGNKYAATNYEFYVYHYTDANTYNVAVHWTMPESEAERAGDYLSYRGTWQDGEILICAANATGKYVYSFPVKNGVAAQEPVKIALASEIQALKSGTAGVYHYKGDQYIITNEGLAPIVVKREADKFSYVGVMDMTNFVASGANAKVVRTPQFVTLRGQDYMIFLHTNYVQSAANGGWVCAVPVKNGDLGATLASIQASDIKMITIDPATTGAGNAFAGLGVETNGPVCMIGYGFRHGEVGVIKFVPEE